MTAPAQTRDRRVLGWLGWAGLDALGRLVLLTASTALFSRLLTPRDFGVTALVLTVVAVAATFVGMPFEEALAQRRGLRRVHLEAALGLSFAIAIVVVAFAALLGLGLSRLYGEPDLVWLTPVAMLSVFFTGHSAILTALARRHRRFNDVAQASLAGHAFGVVVSILLASAGCGLFALVANRLLIAFGVAAVLQGRLGFRVAPRWSPRHVEGFGRFATVSFLDRLADNLTYLAFNNVVEALYGATVLGYVNMAMRFVEPIRGAVAATGHNLAFSFFAPAARDARRLGDLTEAVVRQSALASAPLFAGLAALMPIVLPLLAGPGWEPAIEIAACLAIGCALAAPPRLIFTALSAAGQPEYSLASTAGALVVTLVALVVASPLGPSSVGLARILGDAARAALALALSSPRLAWPRGRRLAALSLAWALSLAMATMVVAAASEIPAGFAWSRAAALVGVGVAVYVGLLGLFARAFLKRLVGFALPRARMAAAAT